MLLLLTFLISHLYAWLHWNPTHRKKKRLPHAPHNNSVTHLPFMKPASTLIVLQPSFTYETVPVSLQLCWSVHFMWFRASRIIKHLQHNQCSHVQNGGGELCCEEPLDPDQASMLGICFCYRPHCLLPWQQTEISLHTVHFTQVLFYSETILLSPPSSLPWSYYPLLFSQHSREFREYTSIDLLQTSGARPITWLIQMSVRSLPRFFLLFKRHQFESELLWRWLNCTICSRMNWAAIHERVRAGRCSAVSQLCGHVGQSCITVWGSCAGKCSIWPAVEGWARGKGHNQSPVWSLPPHARRKHIFPVPQQK